MPTMCCIDSIIGSPMITLVPLPTSLSNLIMPIGHDDALAHREPKADPRAGRFGRKKWIEHPLQMFLGNSDAIIDDANDHVAIFVAVLRRIILRSDADLPARALGRIG